MPIDDLAIVLTGTIVPNAPFTAHNDPQARRQEYLSALRFYSQFAPVYFLENSIYPLSDDAEFHQLANVMIRQRPPSKSPERGKGYQEFEMIDGWLLSESQPPPRWIKISGRYFYRNFAALLADCSLERKAKMIVDRCARYHYARTCLFCVEIEFYRQRLINIYRECNDDLNETIERVLYRHLTPLPQSQVRLFSVEPRLTGINGTTGSRLEMKGSTYLLKRVWRRANYMLNPHKLWPVPW
jgi:hypothetical protein